MNIKEYVQPQSQENIAPLVHISQLISNHFKFMFYSQLSTHRRQYNKKAAR